MWVWPIFKIILWGTPLFTQLFGAPIDQPYVLEAVCVESLGTQCEVGDPPPFIILYPKGK